MGWGQGECQLLQWWWPHLLLCLEVWCSLTLCALQPVYHLSAAARHLGEATQPLIVKPHLVRLMVVAEAEAVVVVLVVEALAVLATGQNSREDVPAATSAPAPHPWPPSYAGCSKACRRWPRH